MRLPHPTDVWTWHLRAWSNGQHGAARPTVGIHDPKGHSQPKQFCDSMITLIATKFQ